MHTCPMQDPTPVGPKPHVGGPILPPGCPTVLIGGLTTSEDSFQFTGIPYLSKLPIIGKFLGRTEKTVSQGHIFVTIQANIIDDK